MPPNFLLEAQIFSLQIYCIVIGFWFFADSDSGSSSESESDNKVTSPKKDMKVFKIHHCFVVQKLKTKSMVILCYFLHYHLKFYWEFFLIHFVTY